MRGDKVRSRMAKYATQRDKMPFARSKTWLGGFWGWIPIVAPMDWRSEDLAEGHVYPRMSAVITSTHKRTQGDCVSEGGLSEHLIDKSRIDTLIKVVLTSTTPCCVFLYLEFGLLRCYSLKLAKGNDNLCYFNSMLALQCFLLALAPPIYSIQWQRKSVGLTAYKSFPTHRLQY